MYFYVAVAFITNFFPFISETKGRGTDDTGNLLISAASVVGAVAVMTLIDILMSLACFATTAPIVVAFLFEYLMLQLCLCSTWL